MTLESSSELHDFKDFAGSVTCVAAKRKCVIDMRGPRYPDMVRQEQIRKIENNDLLMRLQSYSSALESHGCMSDASFGCLSS